MNPLERFGGVPAAGAVGLPGAGESNRALDVGAGGNQRGAGRRLEQTHDAPH
jgi:hypothetical protein